MQIYYLGVLQPDEDHSKELVSSHDTSSFPFFQRSSVGQFLTFFADTIATRTPQDGRQSVEEGAYVGHVYRTQGIAAVMITDKSYPIRPAFTLLNKVCDDWASQSEISQSEMDSLLTKYQSPHEADALMKVQAELDETKIVLQQSIENVLQRGERLDALVDKSDALTASSKTFYKQAKKTNSCCVIV